MNAGCVRAMACYGLLLAAVGCGRPDPAHKHLLPTQVLDFANLYGERCSGCHGTNGKGGPAPSLNDRAFLAMTTDNQLQQVIAEGRGSQMLAWSQAKGGSLTARQIDALVQGIRHWGTYDARQAAVFATPVTSADKDRGDKLFASACASCHGKDGKGENAGAIHDPAFLALVSEEGLRRIIITGRPDLQRKQVLGPPLTMPGYRETLGEKATAQDIADLLALFAYWKRSG